MKQIELIKTLTSSYPSISLKEGDNFYWSPAEKIVYYKPDNTSDEGAWALLHESGHALLDHVKYYSDIELVQMEMEAWEKAKLIADQLNGEWRMENGEATTSSETDSSLLTPHPSPIEIDEDHIQDCLDSYRDWLYKRSLCPDCKLSGVQISPQMYTCIFCHKKWKVSSERFCRPYRRKQP